MDPLLRFLLSTVFPTQFFRTEVDGGRKLYTYKLFFSFILFCFGAGTEPRTSSMQSMGSTPELHSPQLLHHKC